MAKDYIEQRDGGYYVSSTRVSLDSIVYGFLRGESPEGIAESFPLLNLEQILGGLTYYVANRDAVDKYLADGKKEFEHLREASRRDHPALFAKLAEARQRSHAPSA